MTETCGGAGGAGGDCDWPSRISGGNSYDGVFIVLAAAATSAVPVPKPVPTLAPVAAASDVAAAAREEEEEEEVGAAIGDTPEKMLSSPGSAGMSGVDSSSDGCLGRLARGWSWDLSSQSTSGLDEEKGCPPIVRSSVRGRDAFGSGAPRQGCLTGVGAVNEVGTPSEETLESATKPGMFGILSAS